MASKVNRLSLKVSIVYDKSQALKETKKIQGELDRQSEKNFNKRKRQLDDLSKRAKNLNKEQKKSGTLLQRIGAEAKKASARFVKFFLVTQTILALRTQLKRALELLLEIDTALTNLAIVSKATSSEIADINAQVDSLSLELGKLKKEVIDTVTEFSRAGFTIAESLTLAENAIKGANVGATSLSNVTTFLIAGLKSFNLEAEDSARILDVLFRVANTTAINLEGIGEAFLRSANTLATAGASLEESASLIAAANESIQDPAKVGTALKTIASRLRGVSEDGEAIPKLAESFNAVGISIQEADGSFRNIFDIFQDLAEILPTLDELTRESLLEKLAGKRQKNIIIGLLNNFDTAEQALKDALNSTGEVAQANEKFLESLQGRTNQLKEAWNQLLEVLTNDELIKGTVTFLKNIVLLVTRLIKDVPNLAKAFLGLALVISPLGLLGTVLGGIVATLGTIGIVLDVAGGKIKRLEQNISDLRAEIANLNSQIGDLEAIENRTLAQEEQLQILKEQLEVEKDLLALEETRLSNARNQEIKKSLDAVNDALKENVKLRNEGKKVGGKGRSVFDISDQTLEVNKQKLKEQEVTLREYQLELLRTLDVLDENSEAYKNNQEQLDLVRQAISDIRAEYSLYGIELGTTNEEQEESNENLAEQISLLQQVKDLTSTVSDEYELLSGALTELEESGALSDDTLNALIDTFDASILSVIGAKDAFADYVDSNKAKTLEDIDRLKKLAQAEIDSANARIEALKAVAFANNISLAGAVARFSEAQIAIENAENSIALLENERKQILSTEKARKDSSKSKEKEVKILSDLELKLKNINFQIELQKKLLARTDVEEEQIAINEELVRLYGEQRDALLEQQRELEEQGKSLKKGTEEYDDYIEESYQLSLAIEDATNNIISFTKANKELNKTLEENELDKLSEELESISEKINNELEKQIDAQKELADASEAYYESLISSKKEELEALKATNEEREKQVELEELLQNLQDLRERRANILANKTARIVKDADVGFEFIADPEELRQVNEDILDAEKAIDDFRREQAFDQNVERLEKEIEFYEKLAEEDKEFFDQRITDLETFQDRINTEIENGGEITKEILEDITSDLETIEANSFSDRLASLQGFVNSYNAKLTELSDQQKAIEAIEASIRSTTSSIVNAGQVTGSTTGGTGTSTVGSQTRSSTNGNRVAPTSGATSTTTTSINRVTVNSGSNTIDGIVDDALSIANIID